MAVMHDPIKSTGSALLYGSVAVAMNFVNKAALQMYPLSNILMLAQMVAACAVLQPLLTVGILTFEPFNWRRCRQLSLVTVLYTANTAFALISFRTLNIPMYNVLKRLTPMIVLLCKALLQRRWPRAQVCASVLLVVGGCVVAGVGDLGFDFEGYAYALLSCVTQAAYLLVVEFQGTEGVDTAELLYYNAINALPLLGLLVLLDGEAVEALPQLSAAVYDRGVLAAVGVLGGCALMGVLLNYALFLCTINNSALMTTVVGVLKSVVAVALGFFLLGGVKVTRLLLCGILLNTVGGIWYASIRYQEKSLSRHTIAVVGPAAAPAAAAAATHAQAEAVEGRPLLRRDEEEELLALQDAAAGRAAGPSGRRLHSSLV